MSRVEKLVNARTKSAVIFLKFTRIATEGLVAIFFEGEDEKYYSVRINSNLADIQWASIICEGKENVVKAREDIRGHSEYKDAKCLFFVDADFDDNTELQGYSDTYITPCYSIENLYISDNSFKRILSAEFKISEYDNEEKENFDKAVFSYQSAKTSYLNNISDFNYWIRYLRQQGLTHEKLHLDDIKFDSLIRVSLSGTQKNYDSNNIISLFPKLDENIVINTIDSVEYFASCNKELWFRGKQHMEFFTKFIRLLVNDRNEKHNRKIFTKKMNVKLNITDGNAISELSQYADIPPCLIDFLKKSANKLLQENTTIYHEI